MNNKITVVVGARTIQARLRPWGDSGGDSLYYRAHKWNGLVYVREEGKTWLRGWNHDKKTRDALVVSSAL